MNEIVSRQGFETCFCNYMINEQNQKSDQNYNVKDMDGNQIEYPICEARWTWINNYGWGKFTTYVNSGLIVSYNLSSRLLFIYLAHKIRFSSVASRTQMIFLSVLVVYFSNYGVLYVFGPSTWYLRDFNSKRREGVYSDYNAFWFNDIGYQVAFSLVVEAVFPLIGLASYQGLRWFKFALD